MHNVVYYSGKKKIETLAYNQPYRLANFIKSQKALEERYRLGTIKIEKC